MKKTITKVVNYAVRIADPESIILFGSMANGSFNASSDVDLFIIMNNDFGKREIVAMIKSYARELSLKADVLIFTEFGIENEKINDNSFISAILNSGKTVYIKKKD